MPVSLSIPDKKDILRRAYGLETGLPVPLLVQPFAKWYATGDLMTDPELDLARQTRRNQEQEAVGDFTVPHLKTGIGLGSIAASFTGGCEFNDKSDAWIAPLIGAYPERVYELSLPDPHTSGKNSLIFQRIACFQERGSYPLQPCNIASPLTTASYVWGYSDFLGAIVEHPKEVHHLLELVTEATIQAVRAQMAAIRDLWSLSHEDWYMPVEMGIRVSDDVLAVISPRHYREFGLRYNNILSRAFGGIIIHSCGSIVHQVPTILQTEGLRAIDLALPHNDHQALAQAAAGRVALTMRYWIQDWENRPMPDLEAYTDQVIETFGTRGILLQMEAPDLAACRELHLRLAQKPWNRG
jgi:hypothetical protein